MGLSGSCPGQESEIGPALDLSPLPPELLLQILLHVPPRMLVTRCRAVCRQWRELVDGPALWRLRWAQTKDASSQDLLEATHYCPPAPKPCSWARLGILEPLGRNLLRNPCGQEGFQSWELENGGEGWAIEENRKPVPGAQAQTCFVSSFRWCRKRQVVDLLAQGLWPELLDDPRAEIHISDWWGAREDCGCQYQLHVRLVAANRRTVLARFDVEPDPIPQWNDNTCIQVSHIFTNFRKGVRFLFFEHAGKDTQFWAGYYGARITHSSVKVYFRTP
ncbi:F-box only protein 27 [Monodelphis domestica]|uniref:F-box protein 27 n=2 Tax=Monodelphis domestica TaxID=13616 RepID=F7GIL5_MONDO|nr:F-box only protein 27 [Monodelphis domestica]XP_016277709.1 F-box only protein 27 [Monodelphis domestica]